MSSPDIIWGFLGWDLGDMFNSINDVFKIIDSSYMPGSGVGTFSSLGAIAVNLVMGLGFGFGICSIAYSMVMYVLSGGDPDKTKKAWYAFIYGVIGTAVSIGILFFKNVVVKSMGIDTPEIVNNVPGGF